MYWQRADGTGEVQRLTESKFEQAAGSFHPNGKLLAFVEAGPTSDDIMILPIEGNEGSGWRPGTPTVFLRTPLAERNPAFSPDGHRIAYDSSETGRFEVYVRPFPGPGGKRLVSTGGGTFATWSQKRRELFFLAPGDRRVMVASYSIDGDSLRFETPQVWSEAQLLIRPRGRYFDLHPDGDRVAASVQPPTAAGEDKLVFVFGCFDELRRTFAAKH